MWRYASYVISTNLLNTKKETLKVSVDECLAIIEQSEKPVFYYYEVIEEWFKSDSLNSNQREKILSMFPSKSTRQNNRIKEAFDRLKKQGCKDREYSLEDVLKEQEEAYNKIRYSKQ